MLPPPSRSKYIGLPTAFDQHVAPFLLVQYKLCPSSALPAVGLRGNMLMSPEELTNQSHFYPDDASSRIVLNVVTQPTSQTVRAAVASKLYTQDGRPKPELSN
jgi:hypothetical protein